MRKKEAPKMKKEAPKKKAPKKEEEAEEYLKPNPDSEGVKLYLEKELKYSKSRSETLGRAVVRAIDIDDCFTIYDIFTNPDTLDINTQTMHSGYAEYIWTPYIHRHLGTFIYSMGIAML